MGSLGRLLLCAAALSCAVVSTHAGADAAFVRFCRLATAAMTHPSAADAQAAYDAYDTLAFRLDARAKGVTAEQVADAAVAAFRAHGIDAERMTLPDGSVATRITHAKPADETAHPLNHLARLVHAEMEGVTLAFRPQGGADGAENESINRVVFLPPSVLKSGKIGPVTFHELLHGYHDYLTWTKGPHPFSGKVLHGVPRGKRSYDDFMGYGELATFALEARLRTADLNRTPPERGEATREALDGLQQVAWIGARLARNTKAQMERAQQALDGATPCKIRVRAEPEGRAEGRAGVEERWVVNVYFEFADGMEIIQPFRHPEALEILQRAKKLQAWQFADKGKLEKEALDLLRDPAKKRLKELHTLSDSLMSEFKKLSDGLEVKDEITSEEAAELLRKGRAVYAPAAKAMK